VTTPLGLGPHCVGQRVVVRRVVRGEQGPSGGPALTDVLGVMESWTDTATSVRREDGTLVEVARADLVAGKPVPPRASTRRPSVASVPGVPVAYAEQRAVASWPALETAHVGEWLLRASQGFSARANSALLLGDPGRGVAEALAEVEAFYAARALPAWVQVVTGSAERERLDGLGWVGARPGEADTAFLLAGAGRALRVLQRSRPPGDVPAVVLTDRVTVDWLAGDPRAVAHGDAALGVLEGPEEVAFARVLEASSGDGSPGAAGRAALSRTPTDTWVGITDVRVAPEHRRRGLASAVLGALLEWAAERGATTAYLQVREDNAAALVLYQRLGFERHHSYAYLRPPSRPS
jgi:N-acetylglutamate synthase